MTRVKITPVEDDLQFTEEEYAEMDGWDAGLHASHTENRSSWKENPFTKGTRCYEIWEDMFWEGFCL